MPLPPQIDELRDPLEADRYREDDRDEAVGVAVAAQPPAQDDARNQQDVEQHRREGPRREARAGVEEPGEHRDQADERQIGKGDRSEEHTSELQSLMRISYAVFCLKKKRSKEKK